MSIFSLLPFELKEEIASYLSYKEIMSLCHVEKGLSDICNDDGFWRSLIVTRFPGNPKTLDDPKTFLSYLEQHGYKITLTPANKKPLYFTSDNKNFIAVTTMTTFRAYRHQQIYYCDAEIKIVNPKGELLTTEEIFSITREYIRFVRGLKSCKVILFSPKPPLIQNDEEWDKSLVFVHNNSLDLIKHALEILEYIEATDISIAIEKDNLRQLRIA